MTRTCCPFYGFHQTANVGINLIDSCGNQCALITGVFSPCRLETAGHRPDWERCGVFNIPDNAEIVAGLRKVALIFPDELSGDGIPFNEWYAERTQKALGAGQKAADA